MEYIIRKSKSEDGGDKFYAEEYQESIRYMKDKIVTFGRWVRASHDYHECGYCTTIESAKKRLEDLIKFKQKHYEVVYRVEG